MKVPEEFVDAALEAGEWSGAAYTLGDEARVRKALEAVLPKVRNLVEDSAESRAAMTAAAQKEIDGNGPGCGCPQCIALSSIRLAFDVAFSEIHPCR